jgi:coenzyme PQQ synthesis protein D (PqqD)
MIRRVADLTLESVVARRAEPLTAPVDGELVMLDPRRSRYFGLDAVGHRIWELLESPRSVGALCTELQREFDVDAESCQGDVLAFLEQLEKAELVELR